MDDSGRPRCVPACHVFDVDDNSYAYDMNTQHLVAVEPELAELLRGDGPGTPASRAALKQAQAERLFSSHRPRLVPRAPDSPETIESNLRHLVLTLTESCNLRCAYCLHGAGLAGVRPHSRRHMSVGTALLATDYYLDRCDPERPPCVSFYGGEPLRNLELIEAVAERVRKSPRGEDSLLTIDTNGVLLDDDAIDLVLRRRMRLQVSLDGPAAIHDQHRREVSGAPTHAWILANLGRLLDRDPGAAERLSFVVTLAPPVDLPAVADFFAAFPPFIERGIETRPHLTVNFANLEGQNWPSDLQEQAGLPPVREQVAMAREQYLGAVAKERRRELSPVIRALFEPALIRWHHRSRASLGKTYTPGGNCRPGKRKLHVTVDGILQPCERTGSAVQLGSLESGIVPDAVECLEQRFHDAVEARCGKCWALRLCSVCYSALAGPESGKISEAICRGSRRHQEETMQMAVRLLSFPESSWNWLDDTVIM